MRVGRRSGGTPVRAGAARRFTTTPRPSRECQRRGAIEASLIRSIAAAYTSRDQPIVTCRKGNAAECDWAAKWRQRAFSCPRRPPVRHARAHPEPVAPLHQIPAGSRYQHDRRSSQPTRFTVESAIHAWTPPRLPLNAHRCTGSSCERHARLRGRISIESLSVVTCIPNDRPFTLSLSRWTDSSCTEPVPTPCRALPMPGDRQTCRSRSIALARPPYGVSSTSTSGSGRAAP